VFVDTKMNGDGQQIVAVYSVRPRPGAPVAAPVRARQDLERPVGRLDRPIEPARLEKRSPG